MDTSNKDKNIINKPILPQKGIKKKGIPNKATYKSEITNSFNDTLSNDFLHKYTRLNIKSHTKIKITK